jgi:hypothetical protein
MESGNEFDHTNERKYKGIDGKVRIAQYTIPYHSIQYDTMPWVGREGQAGFG